MDDDLVILSWYDRTICVFINGTSDNSAALLLTEWCYICAAAAALRYSDAYFCKLFKQCFKVNFSAYLNEYRVNKARQLILDPRLSLKDIGAAVGYSDANYFTRVFKRLTGQTPSEYRVAAAEKAVQG